MQDIQELLYEIFSWLTSFSCASRSRLLLFTCPKSTNEWKASEGKEKLKFWCMCAELNEIFMRWCFHEKIGLWSGYFTGKTRFQSALIRAINFLDSFFGFCRLNESKIYLINSHCDWLSSFMMHEDEVHLRPNFYYSHSPNYIILFNIN